MKEWPLVARRLLVLLGLLLAVPAGASAQLIAGRVIDHETGQVLRGVSVSLAHPDRPAEAVELVLTDDLGLFALPVPGEGTWRVRAELIGYATVSERVTTAPTERVELQIRMPVEAVELEEPMVVTGRSLQVNADIQAFYDRRARGELSGLGKYIVRADIERMRPSEASDMLRTVSGLHAMRGRSGHGTLIRMGSCIPAIFVDGIQINRSDLRSSLDDFVATGAIEGVEIYRGSQSQVGRFHDPRGCGLILIWTRRGVLRAQDDEEGRGWTRPAIAVGILLTYFLFR